MENDFELSYEDLVENKRLLQEVLNEENDEIAKNNTKYAIQREAVEKAIKVLTDANIPVTMYCEMDLNEDKPYVQWNNCSDILERRKYSVEQRKAFSHSNWWKLAWATVCTFDGFCPNLQRPIWINGINALFGFLKSNYDDWMKKDGFDPKDL